ncbi:hypothetical protein A6J66_001585 [Yersinia enterocolitica]|nr:hypothetical protein A6J66_001585 [Yersinia enterocolitica]
MPPSYASKSIGYRYVVIFQGVGVLAVLAIKRLSIQFSMLMCFSLFGYHSTDVLLLICRGLHGKLGDR